MMPPFIPFAVSPPEAKSDSIVALHIAHWEKLKKLSRENKKSKVIFLRKTIS